jgi:abortive infection bacteriophage resistance protein
VSTYLKPYRTLEEQLAILKGRGLTVTDEAAALSQLSRIGYYRLSGYLYPFRKATLAQDPITRKFLKIIEDNFVPGTTFQHGLDLYVFDKRLRLLVLDALERIEVAVRVEIAYVLGVKDTFAHRNANVLHGNFAKKINARSGRTGHQEWLEKYDERKKRSREDFVEHFKQKYGFPLPIWVAIELWDFGLLSRFFAGMAVKDKERVSTRFGVPQWEVMETWLRTLNYVRNVVAHHSRLWNRNLIDQPKMPRPGLMPEFDPVAHPDIVSRLYVVLCILAHLIRTVSPNSTWARRVLETVDAIPRAPGVGVGAMGFPQDWRTHAFWAVGTPAVGTPQAARP